MLVLVLVGTTASVSGKSKLVEISTLAKSQGINLSNLFPDPPVFCYAGEAVRVNGKDKVSYRNAIFLLVEQIQTAGKLYVSSGTKCIQTNDLWSDKYPKSQWSFKSYWNHFPALHEGVEYLATFQEGSDIWCRIPRLEVVNYLWDSEGGGWDKVSYRKVVIFIAGGEYPGFKYLDRFFPEYSYSEYYVSKDSLCFSNKDEALLKGYRVLE